MDRAVGDGRSTLDNSAVIATLNAEPGHQSADAAIAEGAGISTVNPAEVVSVLVRTGATAALAAVVVGALPLTVFDLDTETAIAAGAMVAVAKPYGLSLGD